MSVLICCAGGFRTLSRAAAKAAGARLRSLGWGSTARDWPQRAALCERCPLRIIRGGISYCGQPLLDRVNRDIHIEGCGCPTQAKAKAPEEHCPLDSSNRPAFVGRTGCNCKWCRMGVESRREDRG